MVLQIAAALGVPPHRLDPELLSKPSVRALIGGPAAGNGQTSAPALSPVSIHTRGIWCICRIIPHWLFVQAKVAARAVKAVSPTDATSDDTRGMRPVRRGK